VGIKDIENVSQKKKHPKHCSLFEALLYIEMREKLFYFSLSPLHAFLKAADGHLIDVCFESEPPFSFFPTKRGARCLKRTSKRINMSVLRPSVRRCTFLFPPATAQIFLNEHGIFRK
jgi:hypothetical protein